MTAGGSPAGRPSMGPEVQRMTYEAAIDWLNHSRTRGILPGLSRTTHLLAILGNPQDGLLLVHVAGTNGKGSICACLESCLRHAGRHTGFFSSPWLLEPTEMFRIDGVPINRDRFAGLVETVAAASRLMEPEPGLPTEYEIYAAMAFLLFQQERCTAVVLETCMGGLLDTTNAYRGPNLAVIAKIGLDHTAFLGDSIGRIARHKAGIMRPGCDAVSWPQEDEAARVLAEAARETGSALYTMPRAAVSDIRVDARGTSFRLCLPDPEALVAGCHGEGCGEDCGEDCGEGCGEDCGEDCGEGCGAYRVSLPGAHQAGNAALAAYALVRLQRTGMVPELTWKIIREGLAAVSWPCRFELFAGSPPVILDSCHNPDGVESFVDTFRRVFPGRKAILLFGAMRDKDVAGMLDRLAGIAERFILVRPDTPRAMTLPELEALAVRTCCATEKRATMEEALDAGLASAGPDGILAAVGSISYVGRIRQLLSLYAR